MFRCIAAAIGMFCIAGCGGLPRDPGGTTGRIEASRQIRLGIIDGAAVSQPARDDLERVAGELGAVIVPRSGHGEELLAALEAGEIDLVYGHFARTSPWARRVHLGGKLGGDDEGAADERLPRFAFRKGENGWIMRVEQAGR